VDSKDSPDREDDRALSSVRELEGRIEERTEMRQTARERVDKARENADRLLAEARERASERVEHRRRDLLEEAEREAESIRGQSEERAEAAREGLRRDRDALVDELVALVLPRGKG